MLGLCYKPYKVFGILLLILPCFFAFVALADKINGDIIANGHFYNFVSENFFYCAFYFFLSVLSSGLFIYLGKDPTE